MTSIPYYPGCTLNTVAKDFDRSARHSFRLLGIDLAELAKWNCCGSSFPLTPNNVIGLTGPANVLIQTQKEGGTVSTLCSFCYSSLKRTNLTVKENKDRRLVVNEFLGTNYNGEAKVVHLLEVLRDRLGFGELKARVKRDLRKLRVAAYYGCTLLRPRAVAIDNSENPRIFENFLEAIGCVPVDFPNKGECCGAHLAMSREDIVVKLSGHVIDSALVCGAELITTTCPLCFYNVERSQKHRVEASGDAATLPVLYFTQLLGLALGVDEEALDLPRNFSDPRPLLEAKGILERPVCVMRNA
jgi:heterodisulfide reductase subunit B